MGNLTPGDNHRTCSKSNCRGYNLLSNEVGTLGRLLQLLPPGVPWQRLPTDGQATLALPALAPVHRVAWSGGQRELCLLECQAAAKALARLDRGWRCQVELLPRGGGAGTAERQVEPLPLAERQAERQADCWNRATAQTAWS